MRASAPIVIGSLTAKVRPGRLLLTLRTTAQSAVPSADLGYIGVDGIGIVPFKRLGGGELKDWQREFNTDFSKIRAAVEHAVAKVSPNGAAPPDPDVLRAALRKELVQGANGGEPDEDEARALAWIARASRPVSALGDPSVAADVLDALARKLDGSPASPSYFSRRRRVVHRALGYAVRKKRLGANPLSKAAQPEGWTPPEAPDDALDYRTIGSPELVESMIETCRTLGTTQGARFRAFYGCMYFSMMRPSEVAALKLGSTRAWTRPPSRRGPGTRWRSCAASTITR